MTRMMTYHRTIRRPTQNAFPRSPVPLGTGTINRATRPHFDDETGWTGAGWTGAAWGSSGNSDIDEHRKPV